MSRQNRKITNDLANKARSAVAGRNRKYSGMEVRIVTVASTINAAVLDGGTITAGTGTALLVSVSELNVLTDQTQTINVINTTYGSFVTGQVIQVARVGSKWVVVAGGGSGNSLFQFKTTTNISSGDPTDGSVGDGSANLWTFNGTSYGIDSSALYDIINPWPTTVSIGKLLTAYQHPTHTDKYIMVQAECEETTDGGGDGGTDPPADPEGYCINDTTGAVTSGVVQSACTGTWSSTEPNTGCCDIGGTDHPNVAESWCNANSGTFNVGACVPDYDPCAENAKFLITNFTFEDAYTPNCATTPWSASAGSALGLTYQTGCLKRFYHNANISSSENPPASGGVVDGDVTYRSATNDWLIDGQVRYFNTRINATMTVDFTGVAPHNGTDCATTTLVASIVGDGGSYDQPCDSTDATVLTGTITLQMSCN